MIYCNNCGHANPEPSNFCSQCGSPLEKPEKAVPDAGDTSTIPAASEADTDALSPDDQAAVNALPQGSALLIVRRGADADSRFLLDTDNTTVGRSQDADILLDDISVSRRHAVLTRTVGGMSVKDVGGPNGTYVNGQMVNEKLLQPGDEVQIGKFGLVYYAARSSRVGDERSR